MQDSLTLNYKTLKQNLVSNIRAALVATVAFQNILSDTCPTITRLKLINLKKTLISMLIQLRFNPGCITINHVNELKYFERILKFNLEKYRPY